MDPVPGHPAAAAGGPSFPGSGNDEEAIDMRRGRELALLATLLTALAAPGTLLADITHELEFEISSHHHQGVDRLGDGLVVAATAPDGVIEAVESVDGAFCLGVQWHPEERLDPEGIALIQAFFAAARTRARAKFAVRS